MNRIVKKAIKSHWNEKNPANFLAHILNKDP